MGNIKPTETIVVIDFGAQYSQLIARRVRECNVFCELIPCTTPLEKVLDRNPKGIILSGGPASVYGENAPGFDPRVFDSGIPVLGICYGMQWMARALGGEVSPAPKREFGRTRLEVMQFGGLFRGLEFASDSSMYVWMSHGDHISSPPPGFSITARTENSPVVAMENEERHLYGVQFHPEVVHTPNGKEIFRNFVIGICGCSGNWTMENFVVKQVRQIREKVGDRSVLCALSGGIDSSVAAALVHKAIGDQLTCIFVDHGFMRKGEPEQVVHTFRDTFQMRLIHIDARERFLRRLQGVIDPEDKRKAIGQEFIKVFEEEASKLGDIDFLVQGTLYPDVIESGSDQAAVIKSHHNVGGLPEVMNFELLEPLRFLFKDEVRVLAQELGLPEEIVWRQPFPGPGLAIRVLGEVTAEKLAVVREADAIVVEEIEKAGLARQVWQCFAVLTNSRTVGVKGDDRSYEYMAGVRAVVSEDGMTADWARLPYDVLEKISNRLINEVDGINRVTYDISSKPPSTIEWE